MRSSDEATANGNVKQPSSTEERETILLRILAAAFFRRVGSAVGCVVKDVKEEETQ